MFFGDKVIVCSLLGINLAGCRAGFFVVSKYFEASFYVNESPTSLIMKFGVNIKC